MFISRKVLVLFAGLALVGTSGCGGASNQNVEKVRPISSQFRKLQPGDFWRTSAISHDGGYTGEINVAITQDVSGSLVETTSAGGQISTRWLNQDRTTRDVRMTRINLTNVPDAPIVFPGNWFVGMSHTISIGSFYATINVDGEETVSVPAGTFRTWRTRQTQDTPDLKTAGTYWFAPDIGTWVKAEYTATTLTGPYKGLSDFYQIFLSRSNTLDN